MWAIFTAYGPAAAFAHVRPAGASPPPSAQRGRPSRCDVLAFVTDGDPDGAVPPCKHDPEQRPEHGRGETVHQAAARDRELDAILVERLRRTERLEQMRMSPDGKRAGDLLVAESPAGDVAEVTHRPSKPRATEADRHGDATVVANAAFLLFDSYQCGWRQCRERPGLFVPAEEIGCGYADDRGIRKRGQISGRL